MKLLTFCPSGFDGVETSFPKEQYSKQQQQRSDAIKSHGLQLIAQHRETVTANFSDYKSEFESRLWDISQRIAHQSGVKIIHESHRGRFSFAAHVTRKFLLARSKVNSYLVKQFFPWQLSHRGAANIFLFYAICGFVGFIMTYQVMPETKNKSIEEIEQQLDSTPAIIGA